MSLFSGFFVERGFVRSGGGIYWGGGRNTPQAGLPENFDQDGKKIDTKFIKPY